MPTGLQLAETPCADLVQEEATDFRVHSRVYTDPLVYEQEMREIFEKSWLYIGHESEIAHPGDYRTGRIGTQPLIIARSKDGGISVLLNVCRHRANAICREERENSLGAGSSRPRTGSTGTMPASCTSPPLPTSGSAGTRSGLSSSGRV